jgi:hypothetical protein
MLAYVAVLKHACQQALNVKNAAVRSKWRHCDTLVIYHCS